MILINKKHLIDSLKPLGLGATGLYRGWKWKLIGIEETEFMVMKEDGSIGPNYDFSYVCTNLSSTNEFFIKTLTCRVRDIGEWGIIVVGHQAINHSIAGF